MVDRATRGAARTATLVALPIAVLVGIATFWWLGGLGADRAPKPERPRSTAPVTVPAAALPDQAAATCRGLVAKLPGALRTEPRRRADRPQHPERLLTRLPPITADRDPLPPIKEKVTRFGDQTVDNSKI